MKTLLRERRIRRRLRSAFLARSVAEQVWLGESIYYLCPGCGIPLPREYMHYCDCCGQKLEWNAVEDADGCGPGAPV